MNVKVKNLLKNIDLIVMCGLLVVIFLTMFLQVLFRYCLNAPITWSEEIARYSYVWITMLAFGYNERTKNNISMTLLTEKFPRVVRLILELLSDAAVLVTCCLAYRPILQYVQMQAKMTSNVLGYPLSYVAVSILIGFTYLMIAVAIHMVARVRNFRKEHP